MRLRLERKNAIISEEKKLGVAEGENKRDDTY